MNTEQLRKTLRLHWLSYYKANRDWLARLGVWVNCEGERRPSSSFILATLSILEPELTQMLPLIVDLTSNPDRIVMALGLNINPDAALQELEASGELPPTVYMLPNGSTPSLTIAPPPALTSADEACSGVVKTSHQPYRRID